MLIGFILAAAALNAPIPTMAVTVLFEGKLGLSTLVDEIDEGVVDTGINAPTVTWDNGSPDEILASLRADGFTNDEILEYLGRQ
jgi:hypothetical protein